MIFTYRKLICCSQRSVRTWLSSVENTAVNSLALRDAFHSGWLPAGIAFTTEVIRSLLSMPSKHALPTFLGLMALSGHLCYGLVIGCLGLMRFRCLFSEKYAQKMS